MIKYKKKIDQLKEIKSRQQLQIRVKIVKLEEELQQVLDEINKKEEEIYKLNQSKFTIRQDFYAPIKQAEYKYQDVQGVDFAIDKISRNILDLDKIKADLVVQLKEIEKKISDEKLILKSLIIKEEKYGEFARMIA